VCISFDPSSIAVPITKAVLTETGKYFIDQVIPAGDGGSKKPPPTATWQDEWQNAAAGAYTRNPKLGNPRHYADTYCSGKAFLTSDGYLVPGASVSQSQAYNAWLKDKNVAEGLDKYFGDKELGRLAGADGGS
jgi:hypothetical protein